MSHSRRDRRGGWSTSDISSSPYGYVWGESGKRYAKRLKGKLARRHIRASIRHDLALVEQDEWENYQEQLSEYEYFDDDSWTDDFDCRHDAERDDDYDYWEMEI